MKRKVRCPRVYARVKQAGDLVIERIDRGNICAFVDIAFKTRICEVMFGGHPTVSQRQNVINMMRNRR